jgi:hypothetical protein
MGLGEYVLDHSLALGCSVEAICKFLDLVQGHYRRPYDLPRLISHIDAKVLARFLKERPTSQLTSLWQLYYRTQQRLHIRRSTS